jgi:hypothetical protein
VTTSCSEWPVTLRKAPSVKSLIQQAMNQPFFEALLMIVDLPISEMISYTSLTARHRRPLAHTPERPAFIAMAKTHSAVVTGPI